MSRILVVGAIFSPKALEVLRSSRHEVEWIRRAVSAEELQERLVDSDACILAGEEKIDGRMLETATRLRVVVVLATVFADWVDVVAARRNNVEVIGTPGFSGDAVAELALGLMITATRRMIHGIMAVRRGEWQEQQGLGLAGRRLSIIGLGAIGEQFAKMASTGLGMRVSYYSRRRRESLEKSLGLEYVALPGLLSNADVVSLHCPLTAETRCMIGAAEFDLVKPGTVLINTARAWLVEPAALLQALRTGRVATAAFDVYYQEPAGPPNEDPFGLLRLADDKFILTPHSGYATITSVDRMSVAGSRTILRLLDV